MDSRILQVFHNMPDALPLYEAAEKAILAAFPDTTVKVSKTQITFRTRYGYAFAWPPVRRMKGWPKLCMGLSFGLEHELKHPRIVVTVEPRPNRWTHHVLIERPEDIDDQLMGWLAQAHAFSLR